MKHGSIFLVFFVCCLFFRVLQPMAMVPVDLPHPLQLTKKIADVSLSGQPIAHSVQGGELYREIVWWLSYPPLVLTPERHFRHILIGEKSAFQPTPLSKTGSTQPMISPKKVVLQPKVEQKEAEILVSSPAVTVHSLPPEGGGIKNPLIVSESFFSFPPAGGVNGYSPSYRIDRGVIPFVMVLVIVWMVYRGGFRLKSVLSPPNKNHDISRLPTSSTPLIGRRPLVRQLNDGLASSELLVVALVAPAGTGKTALVEGWLNRLQPHYRHVDKVFVWSFHSQENSGSPSHSGLFFNTALTFFGHQGEMPDSETKRAICLGRLLLQQSFLLILDGLETLQYPSTSPDASHEGYCSDLGVYRLLRFLRTEGLHKKYKNCFLVITSRQSVRELSLPTPYAGYREMVLDNLTAREGVRLLKAIGVRQHRKYSYSYIVKTVHGHALGLLLLGRLLVREPRKRASLLLTKELLAPGESGEHVPRILRYYDEKIWPKESVHGIFLRVFGLFDRPMNEPEMQIVCADAPFAQPLSRMHPSAFSSMLGDLERAELVYPSFSTRCWMAHPLVHDYFRQRWAEETQTLSQAHRVVFDYFQVIAGKERPETLECLEPLYRAVQHGCWSGAYGEALAAVFIPRIRQNDLNYSVTKLGAYNADLAALAGFFPKGWAAPPGEATLTPEEGRWLFMEAVTSLAAVGRFAEAVGAQEEYLRREIEDHSNLGVPQAVERLCDLYLVTGRLKSALSIAEYGKQWSESRALHTWRRRLYSQQAIALGRLGAWSDSQLAFQAVEALQAVQIPDYPYLSALAAKEYVELLLEQKLAPLAEISQRMERALSRSMESEQPLSMALSLLSQGNVLIAMKCDDKAQDAYDNAISLLKSRENLLFLAEAYLQRSLFMRRQREPEEARRDWEEGMSIAQRCGLALLVVDGKLLEGHMLLDENRPDEAENALVHAENLIAHMGYVKRRAAALVLRTRFS